MCRGVYQVKPELPFTPGREVCAEVVATGPGVTRAAVGDRVLGLTTLPHGGFAEYALMDQDKVHQAPASLDDAQAASLFIGYQTGWFGLHRRARIQPGETLLVHAAAGGVGSAAIQLGKAAGAQVIGVVGGEAKAEYARKLGADLVIDRRNEDFVERSRCSPAARARTSSTTRSAARPTRRSTKCIAFEGRIIVVGFAGGDDPVRLAEPRTREELLDPRLHWGLYNTKNPAAVDDCHTELVRLADSGAISPFVSERFTFDGVPAATSAARRWQDGGPSRPRRPFLTRTVVIERRSSVAAGILLTVIALDPR